MEEELFQAVMVKYSKLIFQMYGELEDILHDQVLALGNEITADQSETVRLLLRTHIRIHYLAERQPLYDALIDLSFPDREAMLTFFTADFLRYLEERSM